MEIDKMIKDLTGLIKIPSVEAEGITNKPFGEEVNNALEYMLRLGKEMGFKTKNVDGYAGIIEFGEGEELIGIISHLDVVPEGDGWTHMPYGAEIADGKLYGRGASDDKGPTIAALHAMKWVKGDCPNVNKRVRMILGLNEESGWKCIDYYKQHEESPTIGFSPDGDFPCIFAEKGMLSLKINQKDNKQSDIKIVSVECNNPINVVPSHCKIEYEKNNQKDKIFLETFGKEAHGAHPERGVNAVSKMIDKIYELDNNIPLINFLHDYIGEDYTGEKLGINKSDESGKLTLNLANIKLENNELYAYINIRHPAIVSKDEIVKSFADKGNNVEVLDCKEPLYVEKNSPLIKTLIEAYNKNTNIIGEPIAIGGTTYAKAFKNVVAFGPAFPGDIDTLHQPDEYISIEKLELMSKIYKDAILGLLKI